MKIKHLISVFCGLMLSGGLMVTAAKAAGVQHLTCVKEADGLSCQVDATVKSANNLQQGDSSLEATKNNNLEQFSSILLALIYLGLPSALVYAILLEAKSHRERTKIIERLESILQKY